MRLKFKCDGIMFDTVSDMVNICQLNQNLKDVMSNLTYKKRKLRNQEKEKYIYDKHNLNYVYKSVCLICRNYGLHVPSNCNLNDVDILIHEVESNRNLVRLLDALKLIRDLNSNIVIIKVIGG